VHCKQSVHEERKPLHHDQQERVVVMLVHGEVGVKFDNLNRTWVYVSSRLQKIKPCYIHLKVR
jgi:hypothetical protein